VWLRAWVTRDGGQEQLIQEATLAALLPPKYWLDELGDLLVPGTVLLSGTVAMLPGVDQFADCWRVELADSVTGKVLELSYRVERMLDPIG
jgi:hypothetical protein